jgi:hypothetical protein
MVQQEVLLAVRIPRRNVLGLVQAEIQVLDRVPQSEKALAHRLFTDEVGGKHSSDRFGFDSLELARPFHPVAQRAATLLRQPVVRSVPRPAGLLLGRQVSERREALRLGVVLAARGTAVHAASPAVLGEIVRSRTLAADQGHDRVGEGCQLLS